MEIGIGRPLIVQIILLLEVDRAIGYDDFQVPAPGWVISGLWANISAWGSPIPAIKVMWSIRSGCAPGGPAGLESVGLVAWGEGQASATPYADTDYTYRIQVDGLFLPIGPGTYWLSLTPYDTEAYNLRTSGENAVGNPPGNNDNSLWAGQFDSGTAIMMEISCGSMTVPPSLAILHIRRPSIYPWEYPGGCCPACPRRPSPAPCCSWAPGCWGWPAGGESGRGNQSPLPIKIKAGSPWPCRWPGRAGHT